MKHKFISLETPQSSICNLDCVYCYIPKNKTLAKIHNKWAEIFKSNKYYEILSEFYDRDSLEAISLWGAEPSMGFKDLKDIYTLVNNFPRLKSLSTSTNLTTFSGWKFFIPALDKVLSESIDPDKGTPGRKIKFSIQISIDGTEENTDKNRGKGVYKKIQTNLIKLVDIIKETKNIEFDIFSKSTNTDEDYKEFAENPQSLKDFMSTLDKLHHEVIEHAKGIDRLKISLLGVPTLALPGDYTKEDGINFYKYHLILDDLLKNEFKHRDSISQYEGRWNDLYHNSSHINTKDYNSMFSCSAGSMMQAIDADGTMHGCHGSFWYNYQEYLKSSGMLADWCSGERIVDYDAEKYWEMMRVYMANYRDAYNDARVKAVTEGYTYDLDNCLNIKLGTIKILTLTGQLNPIFKNDDWAKLFAAFIALKSSCWMNNMIVTGSPSVVPLSIYRIYGNGTFEHIVRKFWNKNNV